MAVTQTPATAARDTRVRWALEEAGLPYIVRPVPFRAMKEPAHLALHPFGQIPTYEEDGLVLFETGAIVLHIAGRHGGLPDEFDRLAAYVARAQGRPAYQRALAAQLALNAPAPVAARSPHP